MQLKEKFLLFSGNLSNHFWAVGVKKIKEIIFFSSSKKFDGSIERIDAAAVFL